MTVYHHADVREAVRHALLARGCTPPDALPAGRWIRLAAPDKRPGNDAIGVKIADDERAGWIKDFITDKLETVHVERPSDPAERARWRRRAAEAKRRAEAEATRRHRVGTQHWAAAWAAATPCEDVPPHPYVIAKGVTLPRCRTAPDGRLMIPRFAIDGEMLGGQWIAATPDASGKFAKRYSTGTPTCGTFYLLGSLEPANTVLVCEGVATGATLHRVTGHPVACAMDCGNLLAVCEALRDRYPDIAITVTGDDDRVAPSNPGRTKAMQAASAVGARIAFPELCGACRCTDFNDLHECERRRQGGA